jgi:UDPglucose 6-dehydrogenase
MLATRISFMNDLANLCEILGADIELVRRGMGSDARIGPKFLFAGPGFGGSCFPKDLRAAISTGREVGYQLEILDAVVAVNERQKRRLGEKIIAHFGGDLRGKRIGVWGLAFKPGTDDIREAPALTLIDQLLEAGATVSATDQVAIPGVRKLLGDKIEFESSSYACARGADALALVTEWHEYRRPNFERLKTMMRQPILFDGRNVWSPNELRAQGFTYYGMGRGTKPREA